MRAAPSQLVAAMRLPSGKNATLMTWVPCPGYLRNSLPLSASQRRTASSSPPETMRLPSGENAARRACGGGRGGALAQKQQLEQPEDLTGEAARLAHALAREGRGAVTSPARDAAACRARAAP